jgi:CheY-like chemotaxis protein
MKCQSRPKALVVEDDQRTRETIDEVLTALEHEYDTATCLLEARKLLKVNGYTYVLLNCRIPARLGGTPRTQNTENFLEVLADVKGKDMPPVVILLPPESAYADVTREASIRWAAGVMRRGAADFIAKPFATEGRTLDRVIKKVLVGKVEPACISWPTAAPDEASVDAAEPGADSTALPDRKKPADLPVPAAATEDRWSTVPNEPVEVDDFMARFCEQRSKENRVCRKRALLAAARHETVKLPPLANPHKQGQPNRYLVRDLLGAWQGFLDEGVDLPPLLPQYRTFPQQATARGADP